MRFPFESHVRPDGSRKLYRLFLGLAAGLVLIIFLFSLTPPAASESQSNFVVDLLAWLTGFDLEPLFVRKLAHFAEYALLGGLLAGALAQTKWRLADAGRLWLVGFAVAFLDESLQMFSGRGPAIADVWLDAAGALFGLLTALGLAALRRGKQAR